ncbi:MAG: hypothetical protein IPI48_05595 [bacterium]|nr:hypothetical protein [bacterium]
MKDSPGGIIWDWRARLARRESGSGGHALRRMGLIQGLVTVALAAVLKYALGRAWLGNVVLVLGVVQLLAAVWRPALLLPFRRVGMRVGRAVGLALTWILLVPFHALCIVPGGLLLRLRGQDPLSRSPLEPGLTGWIPRREASTPESMSRQFLAEDRAARRLRRPEASLPGAAGTAAPDPGAGAPR